MKQTNFYLRVSFRLILSVSPKALEHAEGLEHRLTGKLADMALGLMSLFTTVLQYTRPALLRKPHQSTFRSRFSSSFQVIQAVFYFIFLFCVCVSPYRNPNMPSRYTRFNLPPSAWKRKTILARK